MKRYLAGMEHFGKVKRGNETLKFHCIDVDASNHSGEDCAKTVKKI